MSKKGKILIGGFYLSEKELVRRIIDRIPKCMFEFVIRRIAHDLNKEKHDKTKLPRLS